MGYDYFSGMIANKITYSIGFQTWSAIFCVKVIVLTIGIFVWYWLIRFIRNEKIKEMLRY